MTTFGGKSQRETAGVIVSTAWVIGLTLVGKAMGLFKDIVVASKFGTTAAMDAYLVAFTIPVLIVSWFRSPIRAGFVPMFEERLEKEGEDDAWQATGVFLSNLIVLVAIVAVVAVLASPLIVRLVAPGFDAENHALAVAMTRVMLISIVFSAATGIFTNVLHCYRNFVLPGLTHPINNLMLIAAALFLTDRFGIMGLAFGVAVGSAAHALIMWPVMWRHLRRVRFRVDFRDPMFRAVLRLATPLLIGMAGAKIDDVIDRVFASTLAEGSISGLAYALRLIELPKEILVVAFSTVLFPFFSTMAARGETEELGDKLNAAMRIVFFVLLPVSVGMAVLGEPFVRVVFQRGAFDEQSVRFTSSALLLYTPTLWALGLTSIMTSGFMAMKDTKTPVIAGFVRLGLKVGLVFVFIRVFEHAGVALATSVSHVFKLVLFLFLLPPVLRKGRYGRLFRGFLGAVVCTGVMGAALYFLLPVAAGLGLPETTWWRLVTLAALAVVGVAVYAGAAWLFARSELTGTIASVRSGAGDLVKKLRRGR